MKTINEYLSEKLYENCGNCKNCGSEEEESIASEKDFRAWAEAKFKEVFGDDLDKKKMNDTIKGFLEDNKDLVDKGDWGELVGKMNASFAKE